MTARISQEDLDRSRRAHRRRVAAMLVSAMAGTDVNIKEVEDRTNRPALHFLTDLIIGVNPLGDDILDFMSDFLLACGCEGDFTIHKKP